MSYCRFAWDGSDVYVYGNTNEKYECCGCRLDPVRWEYDTAEEMIVHLAAHRRAGQFVPRYAIEGLWEDIPGAEKPVTPEPPELTQLKAMRAQQP